MGLFRAKTEKNQENPCFRHQSTQRGGAIVWILLMVALFSAIYYVVSDGFRAGEGNLNREKTELIVTEVLDYAEQLKRATQTLRINGCDFGEGLTFYSDQFENPAYYNAPGAPADNSCHIFHPNGGGVLWQKPPKELQDIGAYEYMITGCRGVSGLGTTGSSAGIELTLRTEVTRDICLAFNEKVGAPNPSGNPPTLNTENTLTLPLSSLCAYGQSHASSDGFVHNVFFGQNGHANDLNSELSGCAYSPNNLKYIAYHVLAVR